MAVLIGIGGISRSGKTFLANMLAEHLSSSGKKCIVISQDEFVFPVEQIPLIRDHTDWENPNSINSDKIMQTITSHAQSHDFVLVEGLFAFSYPELSVRYDKRIMITLSEEEFYRRKKADLRWGAEPDWYIKHIWDAHQQYGQLQEGEAHIVLDGTQDFELEHIKGLLHI